MLASSAVILLWPLWGQVFCYGIVLIWKKRSSGKRAEGLGQLLVQAILLFSHSFNQSIESHSFGMRIVTMLVAVLTRK